MKILPPDLVLGIFFFTISCLHIPLPVVEGGGGGGNHNDALPLRRILFRRTPAFTISDFAPVYRQTLKFLQHKQRFLFPFIVLLLSQ